MRCNACVISISRLLTRPSPYHEGVKSTSIRVTRQRQRRTMSTTMERTYEAALARLASLQSNQAITSLFQPAPVPASSSAASGGTSTNTITEDLNALAMPEMLAWMRRGGLAPHDLARLRCIHVSGTKGKGSVCAFLTSILTEVSSSSSSPSITTTKGEGDLVGRVGTYTSPHLVSVRERIQLDGAPISRDRFARYFFEVWDAFTESARAELRLTSSSNEAEKTTQKQEKQEEQESLLQGPASKPFYFRFLTILAFHAFLREGVRTVVVECGIGAEYDPTNAILLSATDDAATTTTPVPRHHPPHPNLTAAVVAQLGLDHVTMLGTTVPEIARHKAGVCKPGRRCFALQPDDPAVLRALQETAAAKGASELVVLESAAVRRRWGGVPGDDRAGLGGAFQVDNQALAVCAAREHLRVLMAEDAEKAREEDGKEVRGSALPPPPASAEAWLQDLPPAFAAGLRKAALRGRCETRADGRVTWLLDGAHTAESLDAVARWFATKQQGQGQGQGQQKMKTKKKAVVLIFNQQERNAPAMVRRLLEGISGAEEKEGRGEGSAPTTIFTHALFTRNDERPRAPDEPERDLAVQQAAADAMRAAAPGTEEVAVVDHVGAAVARVRELSADASEDDGEVVVLVTGSLYLVGAVLRTLEPEAEL